ncbi:hypothetical protein [Sphingomonas sp. Y38-1Y]|uniref:hypothetical protein n=1 Tax=Sphingomonas sp. Y38-1Y TaxID=3078265 RepID=UPI0028EB12A9|nr:hypothetical protein [Sphingomonas sp. Y38-1Y]
MTRCAECRWFEGRAERLEKAIGGLGVLSSATASVRGDDGLCGLHDVLVASIGRCERLLHRAAAARAVI